MDKNGGPAFPIVASSSEYICASGMTLRDYFAAKAMQGFLANIGTVAAYSPSDDDIAKYSYDVADAMLEAREK
jgi:hypothetical protein